MKRTGRSSQQAERWGRLAETIAAWLLRLKGYRILQRRFRSPFGEIDLITQRKETVIFIEVKARQTPEEALEAVTPRQQKRIKQAALYYLAQHPTLSTLSLRFDLILVVPKKWPIHLVNPY